MSENLRLYSKAVKSSLENAEQWIEDAKLLMKHGSFGHANALLRFAVEESVKAHVCWFTSEKMLPLENKMIRDVFWDHTVKNEFFLSFVVAAMLRASFPSYKELKESLPKLSELSEEQISEAFEEFDRMIASTEKMRQKAIYVDMDLEKKDVETPLKIKKEETETVLLLAETYVKTIRHLFRYTEDEKAKLRKVFSLIPEEDWKTGELSIDWFSEGMRETS